MVCRPRANIDPPWWAKVRIEERAGSQEAREPFRATWCTSKAVIMSEIVSSYTS